MTARLLILTGLAIFFTGIVWLADPFFLLIGFYGSLWLGVPLFAIGITANLVAILQA
jgi:hypothetical protein